MGCLKGLIFSRDYVEYDFQPYGMLFPKSTAWGSLPSKWNYITLEIINGKFTLKSEILMSRMSQYFRNNDINI